MAAQQRQKLLVFLILASSALVHLTFSSVSTTGVEAVTLSYFFLLKEPL